MNFNNRGTEVESTEIQLARLDERMRMLLDRVEENHGSHIKTRAWMGQVARQLHGIDSRVANMESSLAKNAPTIDEFVAIKHKVIGAGWAGKYLWLALGAVLGMIITAKDQFFRFFAGGP